MAFWHGERGLKATGGKIHVSRKKKKRELGSLPTHTRLGKGKAVKIGTKGGGEKLRALTVEFANVLDRGAKSARRVKILDVIEHADNPQLTRSKIITKGCVIKTELGLVRVTSRPSQCGTVSGILVKSK